MNIKNKFALMASIATISSWNVVAYTGNEEDTNSGEEKNHLAPVGQIMPQEEIEAASALRLAKIRNEVLQLNIENLELEAKIKKLRELENTSQSSSSSSNVEPLSVTVLNDQDPLSSSNSLIISEDPEIIEQQSNLSKAKEKKRRLLNQVMDLLKDPTLSNGDQNNISNALDKAIEALTLSNSDQKNVVKVLETVTEPVVQALTPSNSDQKNINILTQRVFRKKFF